MKRCPDCEQDKSLSDFNWDRAQSDGHAFYCRLCARLRHQRSRDARRTEPLRSRHPRQVEVPAGQKWCPDCDQIKTPDEFPRTRANARTGLHTYCKPCHNARGKASLAKVGGARTYHLKRRYGITAADADVMLADQEGLCAICRTAPAAHVDHDHVTGKVRGLLCFNCNGGLGQFKDRVDVLDAAIRYLSTHASSNAIIPGAASPSPPARWPRVVELFPDRGNGLEVAWWRHPIGA